MKNKQNQECKSRVEDRHGDIKGDLKLQDSFQFYVFILVWQKGIDRVNLFGKSKKQSTNRYII